MSDIDIVAGKIRTSGGEVRFFGQRITGKPAHARKCWRGWSEGGGHDKWLEIGPGGGTLCVRTLGD